MSNKTRTSNKSRNPIFRTNFFYDLPPELRKNIEDKTIKPVNYDDNKKVYSNKHSVEILGNVVKDPINITYDGDIRNTTYKKFFDDNIYNFYQDFYRNYIFIISFANGKKKHIKCDIHNILELDIDNHKLKNISRKNIEVDIISVEIKYDEDIHRGGSKASVKKEICGKLRCIYKITGSIKEHLKYKGRLITVADYKKLMKKVVA
jgi:hypothetical protein